MITKTPTLRTVSLPLDTVLSLQPVVKDYVEQNPKVSHLVSDFLNTESLKSQIERKKNLAVNREVLVNAITNQYAHINIKPECKSNIELLNSKSTFTVTTAHQTNLLGGPLYFIQKAVSAINASVSAKKENPEFDFVPIYWLGSEDHDFDELNHIHLYGKTIRWKDEQGGAVGSYSTKSLTPVLEEIDKLLETSIDAEPLKALIRKAYEQEPTITKATRVILHELLGHLGLVVLDGDDRSLKELLIPYFRRDIEEHVVSKSIKSSLEFLHKEYGTSQAHPREINLFYLKGNLRGRIVESKGEYTILGSKLIFSKEELLKELIEFPERFSPNVMLRPVMQEVCLPNLMYVGGGGETAYWLQLKPIFDSLGVPFPLIALRDTAVYVDKKTNKQINQLGLQVSDFYVPLHSLTQSFVKKHTSNELELTELKSKVKEVMSIMEVKASAIDSTLKASAGAEAHRMQKAISSLEKKMLRAEKKNHSVALQRIQSVYDSLKPAGKLQERYDNFLMYQQKYGDAWLSWMLESFDVFEPRVKVMIEE